MPNRDQFTTDIYVNGEQARDALAKLETELEKLRKQYANLNKSSKNYETRERELAKQIQATERSIATAEKGTESYSRAMNNLSKRSIDNLIRLQRQLNSEIKKLDPNTEEFKKLSENYQRVTNRINDLQNAQKGISKGGFINGIASGLSKYYGAIKIAYESVRRLASGFVQAYKTISNFEQANANLATILGVSRDRMKSLEDAALKLGSTTRYTAAEVTNLQTELAKLGFTQQEILDMGPQVLNFATSVGTDLASAASMAGVALRSFGLTSKETDDALGTMAVACNKSALSFDYLQSSFSKIAPVAKTYGLSLKDMIALYGTLANAGFDASSAATALKNILLKLADANGDLARSLGGSVNTFDGIINGLVQLREQGVSLSETLALTDQRSVSAFNTLLDGAESAKELRTALEDVNGELQRTADVRADTVEGAVAGLKSAWEGFILSFRNSTGTVKEMVNTLTGFVRKLPQYSDGIAKVTKTVLAVVLAIKAWTIAEKAKNLAVAAGNKLAAAVAVVTNAVKLAYFKVTGQTMKAAAAQTALNTAMAANPFGAVLAVVGLLAVAIGRLVGKQREAADETDRLAEAEKRANKQYSEQSGRVRALTAIVENNNIALSERKKALDELKSIVPGYHAELTEEGKLINSNTEAIEAYCKALRQQIRLEAHKEQLLELEKQIADLEDKKAEAESRQHEALVKSGGDTTMYKTTERYNRVTGDYYETRSGTTEYGKATLDIAGYDEQLAALYEQEEQIGAKIAQLATQPVKDAVQTVKDEYEAMFEQIRKESIDDPKAGEEEIKRLKEERDRRIEAMKATAEEVKHVVAEENAALTQTQFDFLEERYDKLTKKEKAMVDSGYEKLSADESKALKARYEKLVKADNNLLQREYQQKKIRLDAWLNYEEKQLKAQLLKGEISEQEYNRRIMAGKAEYYEELLALAKKYGQDETAITNKMMDDYISRLEKEKKKLEEIEQQLKKVNQARQQRGRESEKGSMTAEGKGREKELEILEQNLADAKKLVNENNWQEEYEFEKFKLQQLYDLKMMSETDLQKALLNLKLQYASKAAEQVGAIAEKASDFVNALKEAESAKLEAEYQAQLTAAGDNAEQREQIEADYEQKKLDLSKKYADVDMAISIAKTIANGAQAAIKALADLGPIAGGIMAGVVAATTAAEVATIIAQRNAIKSASVGSSGGSSASAAPKTGTRVVNGYSDGGYTPVAASDQKPVGIVHANEWVAPAWMVRENPVTFANLEQYRKEGGPTADFPKTIGFAEGGFTSQQKSPEVTDNISKGEILEAIREGARAGVKEGLDGEYLTAVVVRRDIEELDAQDKRLKKLTSRKQSQP